MSQIKQETSKVSGPKTLASKPPATSAQEGVGIVAGGEEDWVTSDLSVSDLAVNAAHANFLMIFGA